jgi:lysyl-tRNA synthetase class I
MSLVDADADPSAEAARFRPAFRHLALLVQVPAVDLEAQLQAEKGGPLDDAEEALQAQRVAVARAWLAGLAPDRYRVTVQDALPAEVHELGDDQRVYLGALALAAEQGTPASGDAWQDLIFRVAQDAGVASGKAFAAVYVAFLGRPNGPRAGWLLAAQPLDMVLARLREAAGWGAGERPPAGAPA